MAEWGDEEQLFGFARDSEGVLGEKGVRRPEGPGQLVDVLAHASEM